MSLELSQDCTECIRVLFFMSGVLVQILVEMFGARAKIGPKIDQNLFKLGVKNIKIF